MCEIGFGLLIISEWNSQLQITVIKSTARTECKIITKFPYCPGLLLYFFFFLVVPKYLKCLFFGSLKYICEVTYLKYYIHMYFKLLYRYNYSHNRKTLFKYVSEILHIAFEIDFKLLYRCTEGKTENHNRKTFFKFRFSTKPKHLLFLLL
jgi:hypothetical protein